jgi:hypothetical protein
MLVLGMAAPLQTFPEKRHSRRVQVVLNAHCQIGHQFFRGPIADLSHDGFYLRTKAVAREGNSIRIALALPNDEGPRFCTLVGSIARVDQDQQGRLLGLGVSLSPQEMAEADRLELESFVRRNQWPQ